MGAASDHAKHKGIGRLATAGLALVLTGLFAAPASAQLRGSLDVAPEPARSLFEAPRYRVRPPEVSPPSGDSGATRRIIQSFESWTLICDEDLGRRQRICNASQSLVDESGNLAFSWSLAATRGGAPVFLVRAPLTNAPSPTVTLTSDLDAAQEVVFRLDECDARVCVGFLPVSPELARAITRKAGIRVSYRASESAAPAIIATSLAGLGAAIASIR